MSRAVVIGSIVKQSGELSRARGFHVLVSTVRCSARVSLRALVDAVGVAARTHGLPCARSARIEFDPTTTLALRLGDSVVQCASLTNTLSEPGDD